MRGQDDNNNTTATTPKHKWRSLAPSNPRTHAAKTLELPLKFAPSSGSLKPSGARGSTPQVGPKAAPKEDLAHRQERSDRVEIASAVRLPTAAPLHNGLLSLTPELYRSLGGGCRAPPKLRRVKKHWLGWAARLASPRATDDKKTPAGIR